MPSCLNCSNENSACSHENMNFIMLSPLSDTCHIALEIRRLVLSKFTLNAVYHHGTSGGSTSGLLLSPMMASDSNPLGSISGSNVLNKMTTDLFMVRINYAF